MLKENDELHAIQLTELRNRIAKAVSDLDRDAGVDVRIWMRGYFLSPSAQH